MTGRAGKVCLVSDQVHGTITLTQLEKCLVSTAEYNRLHNVLQDSTAYLTYPSNRTSRFMHSLGTAHVAGEMFRNSILNADPSVLNPFLRKFSAEHRIILSSRNYETDLAHVPFQQTERTLLDCSVEGDLEDCLYVHYLPGRFTTTAQRYRYSCIFQAIRLTALLHDLGHPPFSHVTENALGEVLRELKQPGAARTTLCRKTLEILEKARQPPQHLDTGFVDRPTFHEVLGLKLAEFLLQDAVHTWSLSRNEKARHFALLVKHLTLRTLAGASPFTRTLHSLVASDIDADRLDYVLRDSMASGLGQGIPQLGRLLRSFCLVSLPASPPFEPQRKANLSRQFAFLPSVRALGDLESFFLARFALYKQAIYHHRVIKMDALLAEAISTLAHEILTGRRACCSRQCPMERRRRSESLTNGSLLPQNASGLWMVFPAEVKRISGSRHNRYLQWDDAWLLGILRTRFMEIQDCKKRSSESVLQDQLSELLANTKRYHSLFKRSDEFFEMEEAFSAAAKSSPDFIRSLRDQQRPETERLAELLEGNSPDHPKRPPDKGAKAQGRSAPVTAVGSRLPGPSGPADHGGDLHALSKRALDGYGGHFDSSGAVAQAQPTAFLMHELLRLVEAASSFSHLSGPLLVQQALNSMLHDGKAKHSIFIFKRIKIGISGSQMITASDGSVIRLDGVSHVVSQLEAQARAFPPFFVFFLPPAPANTVTGQEMCLFRKDFGERLFTAFEAGIRQTYSQLSLPIDQ
jgi:HD superfamily phosphohydrolase